MRRLAAALLFVLPAAATADPPATPTLPRHHWAVEAAVRLHEMGLLEAWLPAQAEAPLAAVAAALAEGARRAPAEAPALAALAAAWIDRFREEWPGAEEAGGVTLLGGAAAGGFLDQERSSGVPPVPRPPWALDEPAPRGEPFLEGLAAGTAGPHLAALADLQLAPDRTRVARAEVVAGLGPWELSAGRTPVGYGYGEEAVVFSAAQALDRVELSTSRPVRLPGPFGVLGLVAVDTFVAAVDEPRHPYHPFLWGTCVQLSPHRRLQLSVERGVMFGGDRWSGHGLGDVLGMVSGLRNGSENNVASAAARLVLPTEGFLPLTLYGEWGSDDNGGAWVQVPGVVAGLSTPAIPGLPEASAGLELSYFGRLYYRDITWYSHGVYTGGWVVGDLPLGDALGGNGREYRAWAAADLLDARLRLRGAVFVRQRFSGNLYAPTWGGDSAGGDLGVAFRPSAKVELSARGSYEGAARWRAASAVAEARLLF